MLHILLRVLQFRLHTIISQHDCASFQVHARGAHLGAAPLCRCAQCQRRPCSVHGTTATFRQLAAEIGGKCQIRLIRALTRPQHRCRPTLSRLTPSLPKFASSASRMALHISCPRTLAPVILSGSATTKLPSSRAATRVPTFSTRTLNRPRPSKFQTARNDQYETQLIIYKGPI